MKATITKTEIGLEVINWAICNKVSVLNEEKWDKELETFEGDYSEFLNSYRRVEIDEKLALKRILQRIDIEKISKGLQKNKIAQAVLSSKNIAIVDRAVSNLFEKKSR